MDSIVWPENFPTVVAMLDLVQKTAKASWQRDNDITSEEIENWLSNFKGEVYEPEDERRLALWLLCNFTYYKEDEVNHLCHVAFKRLIHNLAIYYDINSDEELERILDNVYFAAIGHPSESGGLLLYHFRQQSNLSIDSFYYPSAVPKKETGIVVFVDDVTLSGTSATRFFKKNISEMRFARAYYVTLFASQEAIERISKLGIEMIHSTVLGERDRCFSGKSLAFSDFPTLKGKAERMARLYGEKISAGSPLGYKNGQYSFGMYYNTPNNTLPIFWSYNDWIPIFPRKEKRYYDKGLIDFDRFI